VSVELPAMVGAFDIFSVKFAAMQRHSTVRACIAQREGTPLSVASDNKRNREQHGLVELVTMHAIGRQSAIPEAGEHERVRSLALRRVEFGHKEEIADV